MSSSPFSATLAAIGGGDPVGPATGEARQPEQQEQQEQQLTDPPVAQDGRIRTRSFPQSLIDQAAAGQDARASSVRTTWTTAPRALPHASPEGDAERLMEQANAAAAQQLKADMREFALGHPCAGLSDWGRESTWARDTGGEVGADGCGVRVLGGVWEHLWCAPWLVCPHAASFKLLYMTVSLTARTGCPVGRRSKPKSSNFCDVFGRVLRQQQLGTRR